MDDPTRFFLQLLPLVALAEVLGMMTPIELVTLAKSSCRTKTLVSTLTKTRIQTTYEVLMVIDKNLYICLKQGNLSYIFKITSNKKGDGQLKYTKYDCAHTYMFSRYSDNLVGLFRKIVEFVMNIFNLDIRELYYWLDASCSENATIINWIASLQPSIHTAAIFGKNVQQNDVSYLLDTIKITNRLKIYTESSEKTALRIPKGLDYVRVGNGEWVLLEHLLRFEVADVKLDHNSLTTKDLSKFLESWMHLQTYHNLQSFKALIKDQNAFNELIDGIAHTEIDAEENLNLPKNQVLADGPVKIERSDGLKAVVYTYMHDGDMIWSVRITK